MGTTTDRVILDAQLGLETAGGVDIENPDGRTTNAELLAGVKWRMAPFADFMELGLAGGPGLTTGIGTPGLICAPVAAISDGFLGAT